MAASLVQPQSSHATLTPVDVHQAEAFLAVAEELHFGRAAQRLHMAQPPLSRLIRQLEAELDTVLFERTTRHVRLTPPGAALLDPARELVLLSRRMRQIAQDARDGRLGRVRLGFAGPSVNGLVGTLAGRLRDALPGVALELHTAQFSHDGLESIVDGSLDLLIGRWDFLPAEVDSVVVAHEELLVALPDRHRLAARARVTADDVAREPWVVLPGRSAATLPNRLHMLGSAAGVVPRIVQVAPDSATLLLLVAAGTGVALTLSGVRDNIPADGAVFRPLTPDPGTVEARLIWRHGNPNPALPRILALADALSLD